jgi:class 3 adenylate cyclase
MGEPIERHGGSIVKTMGDAVMASFARVEDAVRAAVEMASAAGAQRQAHGVDVKLGVHAGPCLMIRANDRHDFFGTTVNVAARLQAQAGPGELVLTEELARLPEVATVLAGHAASAFEAELKGIEARQRLLRYLLAAP